MGLPGRIENLEHHDGGGGRGPKHVVIKVVYESTITLADGSHALVPLPCTEFDEHTSTLPDGSTWTVRTPKRETP
jgi:hypothetical protein